MSKVFDSYHQKHIRAEFRRNAERFNAPAVEEEKVPKRRSFFPQRASTKSQLAESITEGPMDGPPPGGGMDAPGGGAPPMGGAPMPPPPAAPAPAAKAFTSILVDAKSWLEQQKVNMGDMPPDSPELSNIHSAIGMVSEYMPQPGETNTAVADKVSLLSQQLGQLFGEGGSGEVADYIRALSGKLDEFRTTIDVSADPVPAPDAPKEPEAPKAPPKPAPQNPSNPDELAKGLDIAAGVK